MHKGRSGFSGHFVTMVLFTVASLAWVAYILFQAGTIPTLGPKYEVTATVPTANQLAAGARVTIAGAEVGSVKAVDRDGGQAKIRMELTDDEVFPLPRDSRLEIRTRTQVGENYVAINVGSDKANTINDGGSMGPEQAEELVSVDQILSTLQGKTRENARDFFQGLGAGLDSRGPDLSRALVGTHNVVRDGSQFVDVIERDKQATASLIDNAGVLFAAVGDRRDAVETLARQGTATAEAVASRDESLRQVLTKLPNTMAEIRDFTTRIGPVGNRTAPIFNDLSTAVDDLKPTLDALQPGAAALTPFIRNLEPAAPHLRRVARTVENLGDALPDSVSALQPVVCDLNPMLRYINPRISDIGQVIYHLGSASNAYDATGHLIRLGVVEGGDTVSGLSPAVDEARVLLLKSGFLLPSGEVNYDAYPKIGSVGNNSADGSKGFPANKEQYGTTFKYPRIHQDC